MCLVAHNSIHSEIDKNRKDDSVSKVNIYEVFWSYFIWAKPEHHIKIAKDVWKTMKCKIL